MMSKLIIPKYLDEKEQEASVRLGERTMNCSCEFSYTSVPRFDRAAAKIGLSCHCYFTRNLRLPPWCHLVDGIDEEVRLFVRRNESQKAIEAAVKEPAAPPAPVPAPAKSDVAAFFNDKKRPTPGKNSDIETVLYPVSTNTTPSRHAGKSKYLPPLPLSATPSGSARASSAKKAKYASPGTVTTQQSSKKIMRLYLVSDPESQHEKPSSSSSSSSSEASESEDAAEEKDGHASEATPDESEDNCDEYITSV